MKLYWLKWKRLFINRSKLHAVGRRNFNEFAGMLSDEEVNELEKIIKEGCEQIHPDDWK